MQKDVKYLCPFQDCLGQFRFSSQEFWFMEKGVHYWLSKIKKAQFLLLKTSQSGPGAAQEKFDELTSPIWAFYVR